MWILHYPADYRGRLRVHRHGTALSGKVYRIVAPTHGAEDEAVLRGARDAWPIGRFDGNYVYAQPYPQPLRAYVGDSESAMPSTLFMRPGPTRVELPAH